MEILVAIALLWLIGKSEVIGGLFKRADTRSWPEKWAELNRQEASRQAKEENKNG